MDHAVAECPGYSADLAADAVEAGLCIRLLGVAQAVALDRLRFFVVRRHLDQLACVFERAWILVGDRFHVEIEVHYFSPIIRVGVGSSWTTVKPW